MLQLGCDFLRTDIAQSANRYGYTKRNGRTCLNNDTTALMWHDDDCESS